MANLTPPPPAKVRSPAAGGDTAKSGDGSCRPTSPDVLVDATGRTAPSNPGWTVKHVSGKDAAMNAVKVLCCLSVVHSLAGVLLHLERIA